MINIHYSVNSSASAPTALTLITEKITPKNFILMFATLTNGKTTQGLPLRRLQVL
jgi:hypothetical protein